MDYGGCDKRRTKGDLKKKRLNRAYKRGGKFRTQNVEEVRGEEKNVQEKGNGKKKKGKKR